MHFPHIHATKNLMFLPSTPACTPTHRPTHANVTNHTDVPLSVTVVMFELEPKAALKAFMPASVTLLSPVCVCQQSIRAPTRRATHSPIPTPEQPAGADRRQHPLAMHLPHKHTTLNPIFLSSIRACTPTHGPTHANVTNHSDVPLSVTVVMVELEPKAAPKAFKPASVTR